MPRYRPHRDVISRMLDDEAVILDLQSGEYFGLNETGARIWELLEQHDTSEIAQLLAGEFDVTSEQAAEEVDALIQRLLDQRLVEAASPSE